MRTRIIPKMLNDEVEEYLTRNDIKLAFQVRNCGKCTGISSGFGIVSEALTSRAHEACDWTCINWSSIFYARSDCKWKRNGSGQHSGRNSLSDRNCESLLPGFKDRFISVHMVQAHMTVKRVRW